MNSIIGVDKLSKTYGKDSTKVEALREVSFDVAQGEFVAIVGSSGSGKSTLLHMLGGLDHPTSGTVHIDGENLYALKERERAVFRRRKIGFIFQSFNLIPVLSVEENIQLPLLLDHRQPDKEYIRDLIHTLGLDDRRRHLPSELSGGQQQRVAIGRALAYRPAIVLADEPTGNLDSANSREVMELLKLAVRQYHQTVIVISHDMNIAAEADRVLRMQDGRLVSDTRGGNRA
ncbi:ABC transporter ATP-binding protein [Cohnella thailandensis]|uniref:ABC transporter ATP-binding protein n=1 Tax=Cohnella thailandensis TaxID=557557 RepID=A0A841SQS6_9BACL|nr:ABC transporter ATP-binding protein [Cohnella thailandensis]MBB6633239.1 ABC transporter ATP-binding protein [Cohnella thailandensis]MBP1975063.1 putative ABC transport system ATP-binding protein [Cohnella thailandensis]